VKAVLTLFWNSRASSGTLVDMSNTLPFSLRLALAAVSALLVARMPAALATDISGVVTAVHDGDTFTIDGRTKIRVFGIDAPELRQQCRLDAIHRPGPSPCVPCGEHARDALAGLLMGKTVTCVDRGKSYDRAVGECTVGKIEVGLWMLSSGQAFVYRQFLKKGDRSAYNGAEASARRAAEGVWSMTVIPPADWRNHKARLECER
jgi:endonuclease YncB( thermonuclease family)